MIARAAALLLLTCVSVAFGAEPAGINAFKRETHRTLIAEVIEQDTTVLVQPQDKWFVTQQLARNPMNLVAKAPPNGRIQPQWWRSPRMHL